MATRENHKRDLEMVVRAWPVWIVIALVGWFVWQQVKPEPDPPKPLGERICAALVDGQTPFRTIGDLADRYTPRDLAELVANHVGPECPDQLRTNVWLIDYLARFDINAERVAEIGGVPANP